MIKFIHPAIFFFIGLCLLPWLKGRALKGMLLTLPLLSFLDVLTMHPGVYGQLHYLGLHLITGRVDRLAFAFAHIITLMSFLLFMFNLHCEDKLEHAVTLLYIGSGLGAVFAGDYLTLFIFWELMGPPSTFLIWLRRTKNARWAGFRYLLMHTFGGLLLLAGFIIRYKTTGTLAFDHLLPAHAGLAEYLIMAGIGLNVAIVPLHTWMPDAYPEATIAGTIFMESCTSKVALYALARAFAGFSILIPFGVLTALWGVAYATIENDARRILCYHIVSQMGYMVAAVGIGTKLAVNAAVAHAYANILFKSLMLMAVGAVLYRTGKSKLSELGGLYKSMPWTLVFYVIGGLSISGCLFTNGYVSKGMVLAAAHETGHLWTMLLLFVAAIGTFLSVGLKLPYFAFFGDDKGFEVKEAPWHMLLPMAITAYFCLLHGIYPQSFYELLPYHVEYHAYGLHHMVETLQLLLLTGLAFYLLHHRLKPEPKINLDVDWFYRKGMKALMRLFAFPIAGVDGWVSELYARVGLRGLMGTARSSAWFDRKGIDTVVDGTAYGVRAGGGVLRQVQTGKIAQYVGMAIVIFFTILTVCLWRRW